jgi:hypothetical protein
VNCEGCFPAPGVVDVPVEAFCSCKFTAVDPSWSGNMLKTSQGSVCLGISYKTTIINGHHSCQLSGGTVPIFLPLSRLSRFFLCPTNAPNLAAKDVPKI